jgi:hypothetical protein
LQTHRKGFLKSTSSASPGRPSVDPSAPCGQNRGPDHVKRTNRVSFRVNSKMMYCNTMRNMYMIYDPRCIACWFPSKTYSTS